MNEPRRVSDVIERWRQAYDAQPSRTKAWYALLGVAILGVLTLYIIVVREIAK